MELYYRIATLSRNWAFFNRRSLDPEFVVKWAERLGISVLEDRSIASGASEMIGAHRLIYYNPHLPHAEKTLVLGHELGHHLLDHLSPVRSRLSIGGIATGRKRMEWDATVVGALCLAPTHLLLKCLAGERLRTEELYAEFLPLWSECDEGRGWRICERRLRIFTDLLAICGAQCLRGRPCGGCGRNS
jgi:hypothetical protein